MNFSEFEGLQCTNKLSASFVMTHDNDNNNDRTLRYRLGNKNNHYRGLRVSSHHTSPRIRLITQTLNIAITVRQSDFYYLHACVFGSDRSSGSAYVPSSVRSSVRFKLSVNLHLSKSESNQRAIEHSESNQRAIENSESTQRAL